MSKQTGGAYDRVFAHFLSVLTSRYVVSEEDAETQSISSSSSGADNDGGEADNDND